MSWSVHFVGKPDDISRELDNQSQKLTGECKAEFDEALPGMKALLACNFHESGQPPMRLRAFGHGGSRDGKRVHTNATVRLEPFTMEQGEIPTLCHPE